MDDMSGMDMDMGDMGADSDSQMPLSASGVDFSNATQASDFLDDLLDDSTLQVNGNQYARYFWYGVVAVIAVAALINLVRFITLRMRLRQVAKGRTDPAKPKNTLMRWLATATALTRETTYLQLTPVQHPFQFKIPPLGTCILVLVYLGFVMALEFINSNVQGAQHLQAYGVRAAWLAVAQVPLLILLVGKYNWIGFVTGVSYERLNVLHRWVSRVLLLLATFHFGFQGRAWSQYPGIFNLEWTTDECVPTGLATYVILIWMNISTIATIRNRFYEFFVIQHIITFFGFIIAVVYHLPSTALYSRTYIYIPIAFYLVDRLIRFAVYSYRNAKLSRATLTALDGGVTKITLNNPRLKRWTPGAHILISFPGLAPGQNHPATIASTPKSHNGEIVLLLKSQKGFTKNILARATDSATALLTDEKQNDNSASAQIAPMRTYYSLVDGPYGGGHSDFAAFDSVCLIAGSTGITFILPILLDLAARAEQTNGRLPVRRVHVVWCIKELSNAIWVQKELSIAFAQLRHAGIESEMTFYVTCADTFTTAGDSKECPCSCDKSLGPCCCINPEDIERENELLQPLTGGTSEKPSLSSASSSKIAGPADSEQEKSKQIAAVSTDQVVAEDAPTPASTTATVYSGRPRSRELINRLLRQADGESGIACCGPLGLNVDVRNAVVALSDERAVHKGTGAQGVYLHVEGFGL